DEGGEGRGELPVLPCQDLTVSRACRRCPVRAGRTDESTRRQTGRFQADRFLLSAAGCPRSSSEPATLRCQHDARLEGSVAGAQAHAEGSMAKRRGGRNRALRQAARGRSQRYGSVSWARGSFREV